MFANNVLAKKEYSKKLLIFLLIENSIFVFNKRIKLKVNEILKVKTFNDCCKLSIKSIVLYCVCTAVL